MSPRRWLVALCLLCVPGCPGDRDKSRTDSRSQSQHRSTTPPTIPGGTVRWIAIGGGSVPEMTQVSIEQDIGLANEVLGAGGRVLFGGGPGASGVQVQDEERRGDRLMQQLADLFAPRAGRDAHYRPIQIPVDSEATRQAFVTELNHALGQGRDPLLVYIAGHGDVGEAPRDNGVSLWAQSHIKVAELVDLLDESSTRRRTRFVVTTCYAGGFAEMVFAGADSARGATPADRCGFFATTWDLQASGCDPRPDRRSQEGYGLAFLNALRGRDQRGEPLVNAIDLDGNGVISLLEAHTRVRVTSPAADVPTSTSERWLRHAVGDPEAPESPPASVPAPDLPEERAVVQALSDRLGLTGNKGDAARVLDDLEARIDDLRDQATAAQKTEEDTFRTVAASLLRRWPVLDDPWHPDFPSTFSQERRHITAALGGAEYTAYLAAQQHLLRLDDRLWSLRREAAPYERLLRALENQQFAHRLAAAGGRDWQVYQRLLACERTAP